MGETIRPSVLDILLHRRPALQIPTLGKAGRFYRRHGISPKQFIAMRETVPALSFEGFPSFTPMNIEEMTPDSKWYLSPGRESSVHGQQHGLRVGIYVEIIANKMEINDVSDRNILRAAALLHDIGREDDRVDPNHGQRSVERWRELGDVLKERGIELDEAEREIVEILCINHEKDYEKIPDSVKQDKRTNGLLKVLMAADALDRYRAPSRKWWPDHGYFNHDSQLQDLFKDLMPFARQFTLYSEYYRLIHPELTIQQAFVNICREPMFGLINPASAETRTRRGTI